MKFFHITFHFEFSEAVERVLDGAGVTHYVRYAMVEGKDAEGKHYGTKVFPGSTTVVQATVADERAEDLQGALESFRDEKPSHRHMTVSVLPVEAFLGSFPGP